MGAPVSDVQAGDQPTAESLLKSFKTISAAERRRHASVLNYWLTIRGDRELPPLHDLDPLEISDAAPNSLLLELIGGGEDAEIRHIGEKLKTQGEAERIIDAPRPSLLASVASKLSIVAISRNALSFEDEFETADGTTSCWVTLLPLSSAGAWVDYVYGYVSFDAGKAAAKEVAPVAEAEPEADVVAEDAPVEVEEPEGLELEVEEPPVEAEVEVVEADEEPAPVEAVEAVEAEEEPAPVEAVEADEEPVTAEAIETDEEPAPVESVEAEEAPAPVAEEEEPAPAGKAAPGFSKLIDSLAGLTGFYGSNAKAEQGPPAAPQVEPQPLDEPVAFEPPAPEPVEEIVEEPVAEEAVVEPVVEDIVDDPVIELVDEVAPAPVVEEAVEEPVVEEILELAEAEQVPVASVSAMEGTLQSKLNDVRGKADEARLAKLASNAALYDGLSAAYDFALDAEDAPEEYLKLVEAKGLKIQLRAPMTPVVKLAFDGTCDEATIGELEAVLAWALENNLPRGSLADRIQSEGGIAPILNGEAKAA